MLEDFTALTGFGFHAGKDIGAAIDRWLAVIEFTSDGLTLGANKNFPTACGYELDEVKGQHHSIFAPKDHSRSAACGVFWTELKGGEFISDRVHRIRKDGSSLWVEATYNPIFDHRSRVYKLVKFATDVTEEVTAALQMEEMVRQVRGVGEAERAKDLSARVEIADNAGRDLVSLAQGVNALVDTLVEVVNAVRDASPAT